MFAHLDATIIGSIHMVVDEGDTPLPWIRIRVETFCAVWTMLGKIEPVKVYQDVVLQGRGNIEGIRRKLVKGKGIFAKGQLVPTFFAASDSKARGARVILASVLQLNEPLEGQE